jgi:hypothetical protein
MKREAANEVPAGVARLLRGLAKDAARVLTFRASKAELLGLGRSHLALGLGCAWVVGMGRYWDSPRASLGQTVGVGSVVYVLVLSAVLWCVLRPLSTRVRYVRLAAFVSLTAPPGILYAIPVERFLSLEQATAANVWFLACVALWRVLLLLRYTARALELSWWESLVAGLLPLSLIVATLAALNLEHVVFDLMAGIQPEKRSADDAAYSVIVVLTVFAVYAFIPLCLAYIVIARQRRAVVKRSDASPSSWTG